MRLMIEIAAAAMLVVCISATKRRRRRQDTGRARRGVSARSVSPRNASPAARLCCDPPASGRKNLRQVLRRQDVCDVAV